MIASLDAAIPVRATACSGDTRRPVDAPRGFNSQAPVWHTGGFLPVCDRALDSWMIQCTHEAVYDASLIVDC